MRTLMLALAMLALGGCGGSVEVIQPMPNGDAAGDGSAAVGSFSQLEIVGYGIDSRAYFSVALSNAVELDGIYDAWCVDPDTGSAARSYPVELYSSYATLPPGAVQASGNLDLVNYVINHFAAGDSIEVDFGDGALVEQPVTVQDLQDTIWQLVAPAITSSSFGTAQAILEQTYVEGEGFLPGCDELLAVIALPILNQDSAPSNDVQVLALEMAAQPTGCP
jgi:hypothetical protein